MAPVNAPFSWPKSSLSSKPVGIAAQFSFTKALARHLHQDLALVGAESFFLSARKTQHSMAAPAAHKRQTAARRETFGRRRRIRGHVGYLAGRSDKRLSRLESFSRRSSFDGYGGLFPDESFALRKIHGIKAQVSAVSGLRQSHAHKVAVHHPPQA